MKITSKQVSLIMWMVFIGVLVLLYSAVASAGHIVDIASDIIPEYYP